MSAMFLAIRLRTPVSSSSYSSFSLLFLLFLLFLFATHACRYSDAWLLLVTVDDSDRQCVCQLLPVEQQSRAFVAAAKRQRRRDLNEQYKEGLCDIAYGIKR